MSKLVKDDRSRDHMFSSEECCDSHSSRATIENDILEAAAELFAAQGMNATSDEEIADACEISINQFNALFDSKDAVFDRMVEEFSEYASANIAGQLFCSRDLNVSLNRLAKSLVELHRQFPNLFRIMAGRVGINSSFMGAMRALREEGETAAIAGFGHLIDQENSVEARRQFEPVMQMMLAILTHSVVFGSGPVDYRSPDCSKQLASMAFACISSSHTDPPHH